jgi:hypothetical protein
VWKFVSYTVENKTFECLYMERKNGSDTFAGIY